MAKGGLRHRLHGTRAFPDPRVDASVNVGRVRLTNPIVAASGTFGHGDELARVCDPRGLGAVTVKSLAIFEWAGNPAPRLHVTPSGMINSVGLQGPGVDAWINDELPALRAAGARVIASIWGWSFDDFAAAAARLASVRDELLAIEVNVSCPNVEDRARMFGHHADSTQTAIDVVKREAAGLPVWAKLSPNVTSIHEIAAAAIEGGADALTLVNTVMGLAIDAEKRRPVLGAGGGGMSGPAIKPVALRVVFDVHHAFPHIPIIGTGGVSSGVDAVEMLLAGATAVGVGTATFLDPKATLRIRDELVAWCVKHDVTRVADLTGGLLWG